MNLSYNLIALQNAAGSEPTDNGEARNAQYQRAKIAMNFYGDLRDLGLESEHAAMITAAYMSHGEW